MEIVGTNGPTPPVVVWHWKLGPSPSWDTIVVLWGWVTVREMEGTPSRPREARSWIRMGDWRCS